MTQRVSKIDRKFMEDPSLTLDGKLALMQALDPYHDTEVPKFAGWPSGGAGRTNKFRVKDSLSLCCPESLNMNPWDCAIVLWPWLSPLKMNVTQSRSNNQFISDNWAQADNTFGGVTAHATGAGDVMNYLTGPYATSDGADGWLTIDQQYTQGACRVVGMGIELVNTTPQLYRGGSLTVYRQTQPDITPFTARQYTFAALDRPGKKNKEEVESTWTSIGESSYTFLRYPPDEIKKATTLPDALTWDAAEGAYVVATFNDMDNKMRSPSYVLPAIFDGGYDEQESSVINTFNLVVPLKGTGAGSNYYDPAVTIFPMNQSGIYLTGLDPKSTFQLNYIIYLETAPSRAELLSLQAATPRAVYDFVAICKYLAASGVMPPGCKLAENSAGEWWALMSDVAGAFYPLLGYAMHGAKYIYDAFSDNNKPAANTRINNGASVSKTVKTQIQSAPRPQIQSKPLPSPPAKAKPKPLPPLPVARQLPQKGSKKWDKYSRMTNAQLKNMGFTNAQIKTLHT